MDELTSLLSIMVVRNASDLYLNADAPPTLKIDGQYHAMPAPALSASTIEHLALNVLTPTQQAQFAREMELDFGLEYPNIGRFRLNLYHQKSSVAMVARFIKDECPSIKALGLPNILHQLAMEEHGLVLIIGGTGSGKSTTVSAMIDHRNQHRRGHILTIEDPIEYTHKHKQSLISQREIGIDTHSYESALKFALREAPDCIMIGEIRDYNSAKQALRFAETGHLCISTLHATNTSQALSRFRNLFPAEAQERVLQDLSQHLQGIIGQRMARDKHNHRLPVTEVLLNTAYITELIQKNDLNRIKDALHESGNGCHSFDDALLALVKEGRITHDEAMRFTDSKIDFNVKFLENDYGNSYPQAIFLVEKSWFNPNLNTHHSFNVTANKKQQHQHPEIATRLTTAITRSFTHKGYRYDTQSPDIRVQFAFEQKPQPATPNPEDNTKESQTQAPPESGLVIVARENHSDTVLCQLTLSFVMDVHIHTQDDINTQIANIMVGLPVSLQKVIQN